MKKIYFLLVVILGFGSVSGQNSTDIINIPDAVLKDLLLNTNNTYGPAVQNFFQQNINLDTNNDGEIQVSEALQVYYIIVPSVSPSEL